MLKSTIPIETWEKRKHTERGGGNRTQEIIIRRWERSNKLKKAFKEEKPSLVFQVILQGGLERRGPYAERTSNEDSGDYL